MRLSDFGCILNGRGNMLIVVEKFITTSVGVSLGRGHEGLDRLLSRVDVGLLGG